MELITGNKFKNICDYVLDENGFNKTNISNETPIYFVKTDYIWFFYKNYRPNYQYKLITHNSDISINKEHLIILQDENLLIWYGQNVNIKHHKLKSIPIGIANNIWKHGNENIIKKTISHNYPKNDLVYCNFDIKTNVTERSLCLESIKKNKIKIYDKCEFETYLTELSQHFFCVSPNGNGIDCHKLWESLYLKTIPIVTKSINVSFYNTYPILVIDSWKNLDVSSISLELYNTIMDKWDEEKISLNYFTKKIIKDV